MTDDLVKRLRERGGRTPTAAADRIEQLERDLKTVLDREAATYARHDAKSEKLEREAVLDAKLLADTQALLDKAVARVKPLVWREIGPAPYSYQAIAPFGLTMIHEHEGEYRVRLEAVGDWLRASMGQIVTFPTLDAAKAAAQADYERRILAVTYIAPAGAGGVEVDQDELVQKLHKFAPAPVDAGRVEATNLQKMHNAPAPVEALVKALQFYASESLWDYDGMPDSLTPMERDGGQLARAALAAIGEGHEQR